MSLNRGIMAVTILPKLIIFGALMLSASQPVFGERGNPQVEFMGETVDAMIAQYMKEHDVPGMTLAIVQAPYISRVVGYGVSTINTKQLATPKTLWNIGQMTCAYTAVAIMQLVEEDKLAIDDAIGKYLTNLPSSWQNITLRELMGHVSGLPDYTKQAGFEFSKNYKAEEIFALVKDMPLLFVPDTRCSQSATNFFLLALIIEKTSGMSYENYITKNQIERLGLKNTLFASSLSEIKQENLAEQNAKHKQFLTERAYIDPTEMATGYTSQNKNIVPVKLNTPSALLGYGSILASAEDMSIWDIALAGSILVKNKENRDVIYHAITLKDNTKVQANSGWRFYGHKGLMSIRGNVPGFSCYMSRFTDPSELLCVTLCANKENIDLTELARHIAGAFNRILGPPIGPKRMHFFESCYDVKTTMDRLEEFLKEKGVHIMTRVDHTAGAEKAHLSLRPTETLIFGNPAVGTYLMLANQSIAAMLPLKIAVWQDEHGSVWLEHDDIRLLTESYEISGIDDVIEKMSRGLHAAVQYAIAPY